MTIAVAISSDTQVVLDHLQSKNFSIVKSCKHIVGPLAAGERRELTCDSTMFGSIVVVYFPDSTKANVLTICELELIGVFGEFQLI